MLFLSEVELEIPSRACWCLHFICGIKGGEIHLKLVVIFSIENHGLKPVTPENLSREIRRSRLKRHAAGLDGPLHDHNELELLLGQVGGVEVKEGRVFVDDVDNLQWPHEEYVGLFIGVRGHLEFYLEILHFRNQIDLGSDSDRRPRRQTHYWISGELKREREKNLERKLLETFKESFRESFRARRERELKRENSFRGKVLEEPYYVGAFYLDTGHFLGHLALRTCLPP